MSPIFNKFNTAVDSFDFSLKKNASQNYVLEISAMSRGKQLEKRAIILQTSNLDIAIKKVLKVMNALAREVAPGIQETGDLRSYNKIKLVPSKEQVVPGIYLLDECDDFDEDEDYYEDDDEDDYDDYDDDYDEICEDCNSFYLCFPDQIGIKLVPTQSTSAVDPINNVSEELVKALANFLRANK